jgi:hypothetical protein
MPVRGAALAVWIAALGDPSALAAQASAVDLEGAWRVVEIVTTGPGGRTNAAPQPGLLLFTDGYYSYTLVTADVARPVPPAIASPTDLLAVWGPFTANAGMYETSGDTMIRRPLVAKAPEAMAPGTFNEYAFRLSADTLWITTVGTEGGRATYPSTVRYMRLR